jgi:hypothetical protein
VTAVGRAMTMSINFGSMFELMKFSPEIFLLLPKVFFAAIATRSEKGKDRKGVVPNFSIFYHNPAAAGLFNLLPR